MEQVGVTFGSSQFNSQFGDRCLGLVKWLNSLVIVVDGTEKV